MGLAASMGQFLLTAGTPGKRYALPQRADHDAPAVRRHRRLRPPTSRSRPSSCCTPRSGWPSCIAFHTGQTVEQIERDSDRDRWFTAEEAKEYGFVDDVMHARRQRARRRRHRRPEPAVPSRRPAHQISPGREDPDEHSPAAACTRPDGRVPLRRPAFRRAHLAGVREYDPYAKLFKERIIFLGVQIDDASANDVMAQLLSLESRTRTVTSRSTSTRPAVRSPR